VFVVFMRDRAARGNSRAQSVNRRIASRDTVQKFGDAARINKLESAHAHARPARTLAARKTRVIVSFWEIRLAYPLNVFERACPYLNIEMAMIRILISRFSIDRNGSRGGSIGRIQTRESQSSATSTRNLTWIGLLFMHINVTNAYNECLQRTSTLCSFI